MIWRPLLRIARRDAWRSKGRSLLIVAMVMLPVAGVAFIDVMLRSNTIDSHERVGTLLGRTADVRIESTGRGNLVVQEPDSTFATQPSVEAPADGTQVVPEPDRPAVDPTALLPAGSRWITDDRVQVIAKTTDGLTQASFREYAYTDPIALGTVDQVDGRAPRRDSEVVVSAKLISTLGLSVGDQLELARPTRRFSIVGTFRLFGDVDGRDQMIGRPGALVAEVKRSTQTDPASIPPPAYLVDTPAPVTWAQVMAFNARGVGAYSRAVVANPPPRSAVPFYHQPGYSSPSLNIALYASIALIVGLSMLEVCLLAGAAFAVGARRQSRALGLLAATGGTTAHIRRVLLLQGVVLGAVGGVVGVFAGVGSAFAAIPVVNRFLNASVPPADVRPRELASLLVLGVVTGLIAAVLPARTAARQDVVAALRGRRGVTRTRRRVPAIGLGVAAIGAAVAIAGGAVALAQARAPEGGNRSLSTLAIAGILGGAVLTQLGLIVATPAIVGATGRLARWLPLSPRLALRDAARNRGRSAPAVAAILGAVAGSVALTLYVSSLSDHDRRNYQPLMAYGQWALDVAQPGPGDGRPPNDVQGKLAAITRVAPPDKTIPIEGFPQTCAPGQACRNYSVGTPRANMCPTDVIGQFQAREATQAERDRYAADPRCGNQETRAYYSFLGGPVIGDYRTFVALTGIRSAAARAMLARGGIVVFDPAQVLGGKGVFDVSEQPAGDAGDQPAPPPQPHQVRVPATYVDPHGPIPVPAFVSTRAATSVGAKGVPTAIVLAYRTPPSDNTEEKVRAELAKFGDYGATFQVERGYRDHYGIGLLALLLGSAVITLGAAGISTGLAQADARADHATLAAVGAPPRVRRSLAAWQSVAIAGLGVALGTASGFVPMTAFLYADPEMALIVPWRNLSLIVVVVPLVAASAAWLLTRSRLPLERRLEA